MKDWILNDVLKTLRAENAIVNKKLKDEVSSAIANMNGQHSGTLVPCFHSHIHVHFCTIRLCMKMLYCHNPNSTTTQLNLTKQKLGLTRKWLYTKTPKFPLLLSVLQQNYLDKAKSVRGSHMLGLAHWKYSVRQAAGNG